MRKAPSQARARATVDALLEAAAQLLALRGWARFTTNEVAERAGVSIGSLYQYFPNKLALGDAIRARHLEAVLAALSPPDPEPALPAAMLARLLVQRVLALHRTEPELHRVLLDEVPLGGRAKLAEFEQAYQSCYQGWLAAVAGPGLDLALPARVLSGALEGSVHGLLGHGQIGAAIEEELVSLVNAYFQTLAAAKA